MAIDYAALKADIAEDKGGLGVGTDWAAGNDQSVADAYNAPTLTKQVKPSLTIEELLQAVAPAELVALTADQKATLTLVFARGSIDPRGANVRSLLASIFSGASTATKTALVDAAKRVVTRAEIVVGRLITADDVARARKA